MSFLTQQMNVNQSRRVLMKNGDDIPGEIGDVVIIGCTSEFYILDDYLGEIGLFLYEYDRIRHEHVFDPEYEDEPIAVYRIQSAKPSAFNEMKLIAHLLRLV